ncbi:MULTISPECIES: hypothetical protein [unclassified Pseudomonas]|jgi:hypothetical protein|uniref:hypothetical protein n=1 Tax=unclassified Pseudomonas TaxID=196821 RepID=UPI00129DABCB|nr:MULTISPECIES: hypothetical protein [unclassified Pseudomonas]MDH4651639.1 hypothetical protein [Pseudomonas sp. BN606]MRK22879.1 hypothetical protein [Pseudomonas sp. JG-B]
MSTNRSEGAILPSANLSLAAKKRGGADYSGKEMKFIAPESLSLWATCRPFAELTTNVRF